MMFCMWKAGSDWGLCICLCMLYAFHLVAWCWAQTLRHVPLLLLKRQRCTGCHAVHDATYGLISRRPNTGCAFVPNTR